VSTDGGRIFLKTLVSTYAGTQLNMANRYLRN